MSQELEHPLEGWTGKTGRQRNRRVVTVEHLRTLKRWVASITATWAEVDGRIYLTGEELAATRAETGERWPGATRPRNWAEYPENDPKEWEKLARFMLAVHSKSGEIYHWAKEQERLAQERLDERKTIQDGLVQQHLAARGPSS